MPSPMRKSQRAAKTNLNFKGNMKKRYLRTGIKLICICLCLISVLSMSSCDNKAPEIDEVYDRFVYLIEESAEINEVLFGAGIPVYEREGLITEKRQIYYGISQSVYDLSMEQSKYYSTDSVKAEAEKIYSSRYLDALYETAINGVLVADGSYLRFYEEGSKFYQATNADSFEYQRKVYDFSTMKIVKPSDDDYVTVEIDAYDVGMSHKPRTITITFVKEGDTWYLDSPTY